MPDPPVPPQAMVAAAAAVPFVNRDAMRRILEAAAPHLAAAEWEACAQLAEQQAAAADLMADCPETSITGTALRGFAALLREARP